MDLSQGTGAVTAAFSLAEAAALARRAARGAGMPWGLADEAGRAVRLLCATGLDGCAALAGLLAELHARRAAPLAPLRLEDRVWSGPGGALCPIRAGASLDDMARALPEGGVGLEGVLMPVLLTPFAADVAQILQRPVTVSWHGGVIGIGPEGLPAGAALDRLARTRQTGLQVYPGGAGMPAGPLADRARPDPDAWTALTAAASRTEAPTEPAGERGETGD